MAKKAGKTHNTTLDTAPERIERPMPRQVLPAPTKAPVLPDLANWAWHEYGMRVGFWRMLKFLYGPKGVFPRMLRPWLHYFKPSFHPWDHDNRARLAQIDKLVEEIEQTQREFAATPA